MASGLTETVSELFLMVDFDWGLICNYDGDPINDPCVEIPSSSAYFIRAHRDATITVGGSNLVYRSVPEMDFEMVDTLKGGTADEPFRLLMPLHMFPVNVMVAHAFPTVRVTVWQCRMGEPGVAGTWGGTNYTRTMLARGYVGRTTARYNGRPDIVSVECYRNKSQMQSVTLGVTTSQRCFWRFGDSSCKYPIANARLSNALVTLVQGLDLFLTIDNSSVIGSGLTAMGQFPAFQHGYAEYEGLRIFVREHTRNSGGGYVSGAGPVTTSDIKLLLAFQPPTHPNYTWVGKRISVVGGCTKNATACQNKWGNAENFGGFGLLVPNYNPVWEVGGGLPG